MQPKNLRSAILVALGHEEKNNAVCYSKAELISLSKPVLSQHPNQFAFFVDKYGTFKNQEEFDRLDDSQKIGFMKITKEGFLSVRQEVGKDVTTQEIFDQLVTTFYVFDSIALKFYNSKGLDNKLARAKAEQASWLQVIGSMYIAGSSKYGFTRTEWLGKSRLFLQAKDWAHWKCSSIDSLRKKLEPFRSFLKHKQPLSPRHLKLRDVAYQSLLNGRVGNNNSSKLTKPQKNAALRIYNSLSEPSFSEAHEKYTTMARHKISLGEWTEKAKSGKYKCLISTSTFISLFKKR